MIPLLKKYNQTLFRIYFKTASYAFVQYESRFPENMNVRRAVFRKNYLIAYEVFDDKIEILNIHHTSRDHNQIDSED
ncbi:MAG: hypothetical protein U5N85_14945 [Arcicella sp.]|nr:hypothetical protein [Arcicella sp.]